MSDQCAFCSIADGQANDAEIIAAGSSWVAFFPLEPATPGHTLLIPREHVPDLWRLNPGGAGELINAAILVGQAIELALKPDGMNLITSSGRAAEQTVFHLHLHVVPRWTKDGFGRIWPPENASLSDAVTEGIADQIRAAVTSLGASPFLE